MKAGYVEMIVAIADAGSLRAAADRIGKTQPAITKALRNAEEELGDRIFTRAPRGVEPTEIGRAVIARARVIQAELRKLDEEVSQIQGARSGSLHVTVSPLAAVRIVPKVMDRFRRLFPGVHVQIAGGHPPSTTATLRSGDTDIVIGPVPDENERSGLSVRPLLSSPISVITGKGSRYAGATHLAALRDAEWIMIGPRKRIFGIRRDFLRLGLEPPVPVTTSDSITSLLAMIEGSHRVCSFPTLLLEEIEPRWQIVRLPLQDDVTPVEIGLMVRADRPLTPAGRAFVDAVAAQAEKMVASPTDNQ
ncbi:LysR family transcriptional regulator [Sinisalibacter aestuarii]|uniref:LysR family transcriptional regulator n=1 Tax=Sinisalibacter aestuarii TaxID=2949426 RepID=A0ABQ5LQF5_9RHOB|nr:LysR family transcriptional regulator [Sinisalibacter aestuarii]GKY86511.1 LysR family transcriptional regulator [Sinisalibacter aestuarii]